MKHEVTSLNTKKLLAQSLKELMLKKPFSKITVSEIIADCGVNRKTFYYHFENTSLLLKWILEQEVIEVVRQFDLLVDYEEAIVFVMDYVEKNAFMICCAYDSVGQDEMKRFLYADFIGITSYVIDSADKQSGNRLSPDFKRFMSVFYTEALAGMLIEWVRERKTNNRAQTVLYLSGIIRGAIEDITCGRSMPQ